MQAGLPALPIQDRTVCFIVKREDASYSVRSPATNNSVFIYCAICLTVTRIYSLLSYSLLIITPPSNAAVRNVMTDTLLVPLFVPPNEVNARLAVNSPPEGSHRTALTLYNAGPADLQLGYGYDLYRAENENWVPVPFTQAVPAVGIHIEPGGTFDETITLPRGLESGRYRVVKRFSAFSIR